EGGRSVSVVMGRLLPRGGALPALFTQAHKLAHIPGEQKAVASTTYAVDEAARTVPVGHGGRTRAADFAELLRYGHLDVLDDLRNTAGRALDAVVDDHAGALAALAIVAQDDRLVRSLVKDDVHAVLLSAFHAADCINDSSRRQSLVPTTRLSDRAEPRTAASGSRDRPRTSGSRLAAR